MWLDNEKAEKPTQVELILYRFAGYKPDNH